MNLKKAPPVLNGGRFSRIDQDSAVLTPVTAFVAVTVIEGDITLMLTVVAAAVCLVMFAMVVCNIPLLLTVVAAAVCLVMSAIVGCDIPLM